MLKNVSTFKSWCGLFQYLHCYTGVFTAEPTVASWVVSLKVPSRGRVMVDGNMKVSLQVDTFSAFASHSSYIAAVHIMCLAL